MKPTSIATFAGLLLGSSLSAETADRICHNGPERTPNISLPGWVLERGMMFGSYHDAPVGAQII